MINWREYTIYLEQIFDVINVFYTRVNYMFLPTFRTSKCSTKRYMNYHYYFESTN